MLVSRGAAVLYDPDKNVWTAAKKPRGSCRAGCRFDSKQRVSVMFGGGASNETGIFRGWLAVAGPSQSSRLAEW